MALNNSPSGQSSQKRTIIIVLLIVVVGVVLWQVIGLFGSSAPEQEFVDNQQAAIQDSNKQPSPTQGAQPGVAGSNPALSNAQTKPVVPASTTQVAVTDELTMNGKLLKAQKEYEDKYIEQVNKLQQLKLQREIEEMNKAIAVSRLDRAKAEKSESDLLTTPTAPAPEVVPVGAYSNPLVNPVTSGSAVVTATTPAPINSPPNPEIAEVPYVVISVMMQLGRWSAVVGYQGKLFNVAVGDVLPIDGSVVASINGNGVTLTKEGKSKKITISSSI